MEIHIYVVKLRIVIHCSNMLSSPKDHSGWHSDSLTLIQDASHSYPVWKLVILRILWFSSVSLDSSRMVA